MLGRDGSCQESFEAEITLGVKLFTPEVLVTLAEKCIGPRLNHRGSSHLPNKSRLVLTNRYLHEQALPSEFENNELSSELTVSSQGLL